MKKLFSILSHLQTHYHFKLDFQKAHKHTGSKWLIHDTSFVRTWEKSDRVITAPTVSCFCGSACWETLWNDDVIMGAMASQITCLTIVYSTVYSGADQS